MSRSYERYVILLIVVFLTTPGSASLAQDDTPLHRAKVEIDYVSRKSLGKGVTLARMNNGLTVIVRENHAAPVATVRSYVRNTGSAYEGPHFLGAGLSHVLEHLVLFGTNRKRSEAENRAIIDSMGGRANAFTSNDITGYYIDCPALRTSEAIELVADSMQHVLFDTKEYARELGVVQRELEMGETQRPRVMYHAMKRLIYTQHPMRHPTIGYLQVLQGVSLQNIIDFYRARYVPQNIIFVVVGDIDTDNILADVLESFKFFKRGRDVMPLSANEPEQASPRSTQIEMPGKTTKFAIGWPTVALQHPDLYPLDVASHLLTKGDSSRITKRLKVDEPLAGSVDSVSNTPGFVRGWFQVEVECPPENVEKCRQVIVDEIMKLTTELVGEKELAKAKRQKAAEHVFGQQTVQNQADSLGDNYLSTDDPLFGEQYVKGIQRVTPQQIQAAARQYFLSNRENTVYIVPLGSGDTEDGKGTLSTVESEVVRKELDNGLTVLVKRHTAHPLVTMRVFAKAGILSDSDEMNGRAALATAMLNKGTQKHNAAQIAESFDSIGGRLSVGSGLNTSYLFCATLTDDFPTALDYCQQMLLHPTFPKVEFEKEQQRQLNMIADRKANPQKEILDFWATQLNENTPFRRTVLGTRETVSQLTVKDCQEFHRTYFVPDNMVLAIYGDIDPEETLAMVETKFGQKPRRPNDFPTFKKTHVAKADKTVMLKNQQKKSSMVLLSYPSVSLCAEKERAALQVLKGVLTGGDGLGGRLFDELRGARLVYGVKSIEVTGMAPGYYLFLAQTRLDTADHVVELILANIDKIRTDGIPSDELAKVKEKLIAQNTLKNTTPGEQASRAALNELLGLGHDHDKGFAERISQVRSDDVQDFVVKFLQKPLVITTQPEGGE